MQLMSSFQPLDREAETNYIWIISVMKEGIYGHL